MTLVKADLGTKRVCPSCSARFYDLQKRPIECPKCAFAFEPESLYKQRRSRPAEPEKAIERPAGKEEIESRDGLETAETAGEVADGAAEAESAEEDEETVDADEEATESTGMSVVDPAAEGAEMEDIEEGDIAEDDVEDPALLEEVGEEEDDVSGIIDTDLEKDER
jgi:uncharacterized protein (TIGR02300 family)